MVFLPNSVWKTLKTSLNVDRGSSKNGSPDFLVRTRQNTTTKHKIIKYTLALPTMWNLPSSSLTFLFFLIERNKKSLLLNSKDHKSSHLGRNLSAFLNFFVY